MAKATKKAKRTYKCGSCGEKGHNARKCPKTKAAVTATPEVTAPAEVKAPESVNPPVALSSTQDLTSALRRKNDRPARPASPFECPACLRVGILAIIENEQKQKLMRCEYCYTKCTPKLILKWGAMPEDKPESF